MLPSWRELTGGLDVDGGDIRLRCRVVAPYNGDGRLDRRWCRGVGQGVDYGRWQQGVEGTVSVGNSAQRLPGPLTGRWWEEERGRGRPLVGVGWPKGITVVLQAVGAWRGRKVAVEMVR